MTEVIGVRFKQVGKIYYFSPNGVQMPVGEKVIVELSLIHISEPTRPY